MTIYSNNAAGGTVGVTATTANSGGGSGTAFTSKFFGALTNTIVYGNTAALGSCYVFGQPSAGSGSGGWTWQGFSSTDWAFRFSLEFPPGPYPANTTRIVDAYSTYSTVFAGGLALSSTGRLQLLNAAGTAIWTSTTALPATGRVDVAISILPGTTASNGTMKAAYWTATSGYSGTAAEASPNSGTSVYGGVNAGTAAITYALMGKTTSTAWQNQFGGTNFYMDTAAGNALPPLYVAAANNPPSLAALPTLIGTPGNATTFTPVATDTDGTISSYAWTVTAYDGAPYVVTGGLTASTLVITPGTHTAGARYDIGLAVTDNSGATSSTVVGKLLVRGTVIRVITETSNAGGWQAAGLTNTAANRIAALTDGLDTTGDRAPTAPSANAETRLRLAPLTASSAWSATIRHSLSAAAAGIAGVGLYEGNTQRAYWSISTIQAPTTTPQTATLTGGNATTGALSAVTSWDELDLALIWGP